MYYYILFLFASPTALPLPGLVDVFHPPIVPFLLSDLLYSVILFSSLPNFPLLACLAPFYFHVVLIYVHICTICIYIRIYKLKSEIYV